MNQNTPDQKIPYSPHGLFGATYMVNREQIETMKQREKGFYPLYAVVLSAGLGLIIWVGYSGFLGSLAALYGLQYWNRRNNEDILSQCETRPTGIFDHLSNLPMGILVTIGLSEIPIIALGVWMMSQGSFVVGALVIGLGGFVLGLVAYLAWLKRQGSKPKPELDINHIS